MLKHGVYIRDGTLSRYANKVYNSAYVLEHVKSKSSTCVFHLMLAENLQFLYCTEEGELYPCISNPASMSPENLDTIHQMQQELPSSADLSVSSTSSSSNNFNSSSSSSSSGSYRNSLVSTNLG